MRKRLRIAYLTPHIRCDPNRTQFQRPKYLGLKNTLFIFTGKQTVLPEEIERKLRIIRGPLEFGRLSSRPLYPLWCIFKVLMLHKKFRFDLVYSTYDCFSSVSATILKLMGFRWVADIWDHPELWKETREKDIRKTLLVHVPRVVAFQIAKRGFKFADLVISAIHPSALAKFRISPQKIFAVTNGVDLSVTKPKGLKRLNAGFKVFYVGFLMKERGLGMMLHATAMLKGRIEGLRFILVGDARREDVTYLVGTVKKLGLEDNVDFLGRLNHEDVLTLMEGSDVCLFPFPRLEAVNCIYPVKIFEYMAMGKAIVATRLMAISEIIENGVNGLLVQPNNVEDMSNAILAIFKDKKLREKLERNSFKSAPKYDWELINEKVNRKIIRVIKGRRNI